MRSVPEIDFISRSIGGVKGSIPYPGVSLDRSIISAGIDIGTTTTQVVFSRLTIRDTSSHASSSKISITGKEVIYRGGINFTPIDISGIIDAHRLHGIISEEYLKAGYSPSDIESGAVIITGESARRANAEAITDGISAFAGEFVVAAAGTDLESILAGYGSGAAEMSRRERKTVVNFDIGGGTTNAAVFSDGRCIDAYGFDIGGRLITFGNGRISYLSDRAEKFADANGLRIRTGDFPDIDVLAKLTDAFASVLYKAFRGIDLSSAERGLEIGHGFRSVAADCVTFSGGVGDCLYLNTPFSTYEEISRYGDTGPLLAGSVKRRFTDEGAAISVPHETIRATVIGAGSHSIQLSGSTVVFEDNVLPLRNVPIARLFEGDSEQYGDLVDRMSAAQFLYGDDQVAFYMKGPENPSYAQLRDIASQIAEFYAGKRRPVLFVLENDFAKALGQTVRMISGGEEDVVCIDGIRADDGDYIDIGRPIGDVLPVVVKTLVFGG